MEQFQLFCNEVEVSTSYKVGIEYSCGQNFIITLFSVSLSTLCSCCKFVSRLSVKRSKHFTFPLSFLSPIQWIKTFTKDSLCSFQRLMGILGIPVNMGEYFPSRFPHAVFCPIKCEIAQQTFERESNDNHFLLEKAQPPVRMHTHRRTHSQARTYHQGSRLPPPCRGFLFGSRHDTLERSGSDP